MTVLRFPNLAAHPPHRAPRSVQPLSADRGIPLARADEARAQFAWAGRRVTVPGVGPCELFEPMVFIPVAHGGPNARS